MAKAVASTRAMEVQLGRTSAAGKSTQGALTGMGKGSMLAMGGAGLAAYGLVKGLSSAANAAIDFESSFAGIRKTVDATEEEFQVLEDGMRRLATEIPIAVDELNRIGELGGQLGIAKENLIDFTETVAKISVTTDLTVEDAAMKFAQFAEITQMPQDKFENLASTVVDLGNNFATTESMIVEYGQRLAGAGETAGMTEADIMGIGTAAASVGVQAEAGGTAIQKVILKMTEAVELGDDKLAGFAETSGMSAEEFTRSWNKDPAKAFTRFIEGLGEQGRAGIGTLKELGLTDQRLTRAFLSLAGAGDVVRRSITLGNDAFAEANALQDEAAKRFATTESKILLAKNQIHDLKVTAGESIALAMGSAADTVSEVLKSGQRIDESFQSSERLMIQWAHSTAEGTMTLEEFRRNAEAAAGDYKDWWNAGGLIDDDRAEVLEKLRERLEGLLGSGKEGAEILEAFGIEAQESGKKTKKGGQDMAAGGRAAAGASEDFSSLFETAKDFKKWRESAMGSLGDLSGAFGKLGDDANLTADELIRAFEKQTRAAANFKENLNILISRGAKPALIQDLIDMGDEGAQWAQALADANEESTKAFIRARGQSSRELSALTALVNKAERNITDDFDKIGSGVKKNSDKAKESVEALTRALRGLPAETSVSVKHRVETTGSGKMPLGSPTAAGMFGTPTAWALSAINAVPGPQSITSGYRPDDVDSLHSTPPPDNAVDVGGDNLYGIFSYIAAQFGKSAREVIYGHSIIQRGQLGYYAPNDHWDHVHIADDGGKFRGPGLVGIGNISEYVFQPAQRVGDLPPPLADTENPMQLVELHLGSQVVAKQVHLHDRRARIRLVA